MSSLEEVYDGEVVEQEAVETVETEAVETEIVEPETVETQPAEETITDEPTGVKDSPPESTTSDAFKAMALDERRKRQELEKQLEEINTEKPDFWEDPEKVIDEKITKARIDTSETIARSQHEDYDNKIQIFAQNATPSLIAEMQANSNPADFAYRYAEKLEKMQEFEGLGDFEQKIRAEEQAKTDEAIKKAVSEALGQAGEIPQSLSTDRAVGGNTKPAWSGPKPIESIYD